MQFFVNGSPVCGDTVPLGVQGENLATQITADVSGWLAQWPDGQVIVRLIDANRQSHLADTVVNDGTLVWIVTAADTAQGGYGVGVIELVQGDVVKKSEPFATRVVTDPAASGEAPEPVPGWVEETIARMEELEAGAAQSAEDAAAVLRQVETAGADQRAAIQAAGQQQTQAVTAAGAQQVSAVQTEGADQRAAIETAGAAQVNAVQAEGQTQQTAIQQKGADTLASIPGDYTELSGDVAELKSQITNRTPSVFGSDGESDLDVADPLGNVLVRFANGEIETKNFNSATTVPKLMDEDESDSASDLDITDIYGNVLGRFKDGNIETRNFRGFDYVTYKSQPATYDGTLPFTLTVNHQFRKGDRIVLHVERGVTPWFVGSYVNYYVGAKKVFDEWYGDNAWVEYTVTEDVESVSAVYTGAVSTTGMTSGPTLTYVLEVSLLGDIPITPTVVTVKQDGSGDFTTLRGALDAIGFKANDVLNPYQIEIYPGTYDVIADYSDEEIADAEYNLNKFVGPVLYNGMYLKGMGNNPGETVLTASLDPDKWSNSIRGVISTLNCQGSCGFENITVKAYNLRYCVHDDYTQPYMHRNKRLVKNAVLRGYDVSYTPCTTYGAGTRYATGVYVFENCDFGDNGGLHTSANLAEPAFVHLINCKGHGFRIGDNETATPVAYSIYQFDDCDFLWINQNMVGTEPHVIVRGSGGTSPIYQFNAGTLYDTGDVVIAPNSDKPVSYSGVGTVLEWFSNTEHGPRFKPATSYDTARGVVVYEDSEDTYIQTRGYIRTDRTAITTFNLGDYVGVVNGALGIVPDATTAIGRIAYIDNTGAGYIRLDWRN